MPSRPTMEFGYNPPTGVRGLENIRPREYISDLHRALDIASQSFGSLWISDHINYANEFRMECWTLLHAATVCSTRRARRGWPIHLRPQSWQLGLPVLPLR